MTDRPIPPRPPSGTPVPGPSGPPPNPGQWTQPPPPPGTPPDLGQWGGPAPAPFPAPQGAGPVRAPGRKPVSTARKIVNAVVLVVVVAVVGGLIYYGTRSQPVRAKVGDCMAGTDTEQKLERVDCSAAKAQYRVVGRLEGKAETEMIAIARPCRDYPTATSAFWSGKSGEKGYILCLEPVRK